MPLLAARIAALLMTSATLAAAAPAAHGASHRIFGGQVVDAPSSAPFTVLIVAASGSASSLCTGSVIDASHVLTAAHCAVNDQGQRFAARDFEFLIGASTLTRNEGLIGPVRRVRIHPAYDPSSGQADVAVLEVPPMPLSNTISPVPLVAVGAAPVAGATVRAFGWGESGPGEVDGNERMLDLTLGAPTDCWSGVAAVGCARTDAGGPCPGDSGGPIVRDGVQIGVTNTRIGNDCVAGSQLGFVDLSAAGIAEFVRGSDAPPAMPSAAAPATLIPPPLTGGVATCKAPAWANAVTTTSVFFHRDGGAVVQEGPANTYAPKPSDAGHELGCRSVAQSPGGSAIAPAAAGLKVLAPQLSLRAGQRSAAVSYSGAGELPLTATLATTNGRTVWTKALGATRTVRLPTAAAGAYRLCVNAPAAGQFAGDQACERWRSPTTNKPGKRSKKG
jgi:hypothetical protein